MLWRAPPARFNPRPADSLPRIVKLNRFGIAVGVFARWNPVRPPEMGRYRLRHEIAISLCIAYGYTAFGQGIMLAVVEYRRKSSGSSWLPQMNLRCVSGEYTVSIRRVSLEPGSLPPGRVKLNRFVSGRLTSGHSSCPQPPETGNRSCHGILKAS
jgi:hypothetical protein